MMETDPLKRQADPNHSSPTKKSNNLYNKLVKVQETFIFVTKKPQRKKGFLPNNATRSLMWKSPWRQFTKNGFTERSSPGKCLKRQWFIC